MRSRLAPATWEVGYSARVTTFPGLAPERIKATVDEFNEKHLPQIEQAPGYLGCWVGVDFVGGRAIAVTFWESQATLLTRPTIWRARRAPRPCRGPASTASGRR